MRSSSLLAFALVLAAAAPASAAQDNACWNRNVQRMEYYTEPPQGGDSNFFTVQGKSGVIALLYGAKASMKEFPLSLYEIRTDGGGTVPTGCTNDFFNKIKYALPYTGTSYASLSGVYSSSNTYPDPESAYASSAQPVTDGLSTGKAYRYLNWGPQPSATAETNAVACATVATATWSLTNSGGFATAADAAAACTTCLSSRGYWLNPLVGDNVATTNAGVFTTNFLRFYPPKWAVLRLAYKRMVSGPLLGTLREGVIGPAGAGVSGASGEGKGAQLIQKLLPASCSGQGAQNGAGILKQKLDAVAELYYSSNKFPLAEMLFNDGWYQSGQVNNWCCSGTPTPYFTNSATKSTYLNDGKGGPCPGCNQDFLIIFSDGRGDTANPYCTRKSDGTLPGPCQAEQQCSTLGMGTEDDGNDYLDPSLSGGAGTAITGYGVRQTATGTCDMDFADDVADWMATHQMDQNASGSNLISYVVAIGSERYGQMNTLQEVARRGLGSYIGADDFSSFESALTNTLLQIIQRTQSFSVAAITTVQTRGTTYAFIPRFTPQQGNEWAGKLYRFNLYNEVSAGCTSANYGAKSTVNPNGNSSCSDVYLKDANGAFVGDDTSGNIVLLDTSGSYPWATKPPLGTAPNTTPQYGTPIWEASATLTTRINALNAGTSTDERSIYTVYDSDNNGSYDKLILMNTTSSNLTILTPLLALDGVTSDFCLEMASKTAHTYTTEADCATDVINFLHGKDVFLESDENRTVPAPTNKVARPNPLGDIYHSSPIVELPPSSTFLCDLGVITQCSASLYSPSLTPGGSAAYDTYQSTYKRRIEPLLVGANDGMLHAFNAGNDTTGDDPDTVTSEGSANHYYDRGTGREMWAFIPPDLLPKLRLYVMGTRHEMYVDGTPMVKDIWVDGSGATSVDYKKQSDEYHTIAIVGEREGGRHYFALDVTDPSSPKFRWTWPPPASTEAMFTGQSWDDHAPSPPPVGPVAIANSSGPITVNGTKAVEKYVVALGGGFDQNLVRGAGYYILDAWTGAQVYRATRYDVSSSSTDPRVNMFPVAATPSFIDKNSDGLFDTLVVGDTMGQVWVSNLSNPGSDTTGDGIVDNWFAARAFVQFKGQALWKRSPFFQMAASATLTTGDLRVYLGAGSRDQIKNPSGGACELADPFSCMRDNCTVNVKQVTYQNDSQYVSAEWKYNAGGTAFATNTWSKDSASDGNSCTDTMTVDIQTTLTCGSASQTDLNQISCAWPGSPECTGNGKPDSVAMSYTSSVTQQKARFYSIHLYNTTGSRVPFTTATEAATYDGAALTDTDLVDADVSTATATGNGYYVQYTTTAEKTASEALILAGCAIVNTLYPATAPTNYCGGSLPLDTNYVYQADAITGAIACGTSAPASTATVRYTTQSAIVPPPMPTPVVAVNQASSTVVYSGISLTPGAPPSQFTIGGGDVMGPVEWLEMSRKTHECRHNGTNCK